MRLLESSLLIFLLLTDLKKILCKSFPKLFQKSRLKMQ